MVDSEDTGKMRRTRNLAVVVVVLAGFSGVMRWLGFFGSVAGSIDWFSVAVMIIAIGSAINSHLKLGKTG